MGIAKEIVAESIHAALPELDLREIADLIEVPPSQDLGDYSFPCFSLRSVSGNLLCRSQAT